MMEYNSDLQGYYSDVEESEIMKRKKLRKATTAVVVAAVVDPSEKGAKPGGSGLGHHQRLWVKDRSKAWWDKCNQPDFQEDEFKKAFRMGKATFDLICYELNSAIAKEDTTLRNAIPVRQRVVFYLWRLVTNDPLRLISKQSGLGISTGHKLVLEVCSAIRTVLMPKYLNWPENGVLRKVTSIWVWDSISGNRSREGKGKQKREEGKNEVTEGQEES